MMYRAIVLVVLLLPVPILLADDAKGKSLTEEYDALVKENQAAQKELILEFNGAKSDEEREKVRGRYKKLQQKYADRFVELAEKNAKDEGAFKALTWVVQNVSKGADGDTPTVAKAVNLLRQDYVKSDRLSVICQALAFNGLPETDKFLREVMEMGANEDTKGLACYALAHSLSVRSEEAQKKKKTEVGDSLAKEAEKLYEEVQSKYADVKAGRGTLGAMAKSELATFRSFSIGKVAPEIEGEDGEGKKFKLSDYRGKVVLLDFWGNWCPPCRATYPHNRELMKRLDKKPFVLLGVNSDKDLETLKKVMTKEGNEWRFWFDGGSTSGPIAKKYNVAGWPTMYVLDHKGVIRLRSVGSPGDEVLDKLIEELLEEAAKAGSTTPKE
ncbi:MAG: TlpA family protein disulfide reductase [Gemmataceae bacterium]|nr:TlpA family protein disulfide reductase [Gemmataceae bacterium]